MESHERGGTITRQARQVSSTGFYHIVFRGVNRCHLFEEDQDYQKMVDLMEIIRSDLGIEVHAYCLMSNHVHLLVREKSPRDIVLAMSKLLGPYANWFNKKYDRSGALIANRYKSKCVENDAYLLTLVRYIHQNPVVAGAANQIAEHKWSSYHDYITPSGSFTTTSFILDVLSPNRDTALNRFTEIHQVLVTEDHSRPEQTHRTEQQIRDGIKSVLDGIEPQAVSGLPRQQRDSILADLRTRGYSIRQIERTTGVSRGTITRAR